MSDSLPRKRFRVLNEGFVCAQCHREVAPTKKGSPRSHCPFCLYSKHVDEFPGDRANACGGLMKPIAAERDARRGIMILHECTRCKAHMRARAIVGDPQSDDEQVLWELIQRA